MAGERFADAMNGLVEVAGNQRIAHSSPALAPKGRLCGPDSPTKQPIRRLAPKLAFRWSWLKTTIRRNPDISQGVRLVQASSSRRLRQIRFAMSKSVGKGDDVLQRLILQFVKGIE
ncbi:MAG: hypothetical protein K0S14_2609 [Thermomicrobiales bacterium]|nr:hypothetical protein [Thermomicrobiales bacterium]